MAARRRAQVGNGLLGRLDWRENPTRQRSRASPRAHSGARAPRRRRPANRCSPSARRAAASHSPGARNKARSSSSTSMSQGVTTVSKAPAANGARVTSANTRCRSGPTGAGALSRRRIAWLARSRGAEREFVELQRLAGEEPLRREQETGIQVGGDERRRLAPHVQVIGQPPRAHAEQQRAAGRSGAERGVDEAIRRLVLGFTPAPVAVQVRVVARETLPRGKRHAERRVQLGSRRAGARAERRHERADAPRVVAAGRGQQLQSVARRRPVTSSVSAVRLAGACDSRPERKRGCARATLRVRPRARRPARAVRRSPGRRCRRAGRRRPRGP